MQKCFCTYGPLLLLPAPGSRQNDVHHWAEMVQQDALGPESSSEVCGVEVGDADGFVTDVGSVGEGAPVLADPPPDVIC